MSNPIGLKNQSFIHSTNHLDYNATFNYPINWKIKVSFLISLHSTNHQSSITMLLWAISLIWKINVSFFNFCLKNSWVNVFYYLEIVNCNDKHSMDKWVNCNDRHLMDKCPSYRMFCYKFLQNLFETPILINIL